MLTFVTTDFTALVDSDPSLLDVQTSAAGPAGSLPLTEELLREAPSGDLFGWTFHTPSPVAIEISDADSYGFIELLTVVDGTGIRGGIGGGEGYDSHAVFYVGVQDVEAALQRAERLGGTRVMGLATSANGLVVGHFKDPEGTLIGVAGVR